MSLQKSKFGGALAIGKQALDRETASQPESVLVPPAAEPETATPGPVLLYTDKELKQVNAGGLKVAFAVRRHWMLQAHLKGVSLASIIKPALIAELGLPEGFTDENLSAPSERSKNDADVI